MDVKWKASFLLAAAALTGLMAAGVWSFRIGWADYLMRQETVGGTERAIALLPERAEYHARLAWLVSDHDPRKAGDALRRAVRLNPWDAQSWIELGLRAETEGDGATAEKYLLRAAEVDTQFLPRWTLANYYFRHDNAPMFWLWAKHAAAMAYDAQPLFRLCAKVAEDGKLIDRLEIRNPEVPAAYLSYLLRQNRVDLIGPAVHRLLEQNREADVPLLLVACERLLEAGRVDPAAEVWNRLADAGRVRFRTPAGEGEQLVANSSFTVPPTSRGFDWRLPVVDGIGVSEEERGGLRVTFSGREPEDCEVVVQWVPLPAQQAGQMPGKMHYQLSYEYRTRGIAGGVGLTWRITDPRGGAVLGEGESLASDVDTEGRSRFEVPPACRLVRLALRYHRTSGTTRLEGVLVLRKVGLKPVTQPPIAGWRVR